MGDGKRKKNKLNNNKNNNLKKGTEYKDRLDFNSFCSLISNYLKAIEMDVSIESDWIQLSGGSEETLVRPSDVSRVFGAHVVRRKKVGRFYLKS